MFRYVCVVAGLIGCMAAGPVSRPSKPYTGSVGDLAVDAARVGPVWKAKPAIVVEDPKDPPTVEKDQQKALEELLEMASAYDIRSCADYSYGTTGGTYDLITLRIYVFGSKQAAEKWWKASFDYEGWEKRFRLAEGYGDQAVDSRRNDTRIVRQGNVVLICGEATGRNASRRLLGVICDKLREICQDSAAAASQPAATSQPRD